MKLLLAEEEVFYFHPSANNTSLFWLEEHNQSTYRYVTGQSDIEDIIRFLRNKEWFSRRADTSWNLVGHVNGNITLLRQPHVEDGGGVLLVGRLTAIPSYLQ